MSSTAFGESALIAARRKQQGGSSLPGGYQHNSRPLHRSSEGRSSDAVGNALWCFFVLSVTLFVVWATRPAPIATPASLTQQATPPTPSEAYINLAQAVGPAEPPAPLTLPVASEPLPAAVDATPPPPPSVEQQAVPAIGPMPAAASVGEVTEAIAPPASTPNEPLTSGSRSAEETKPALERQPALVAGQQEMAAEQAQQQQAPGQPLVQEQQGTQYEAESVQQAQAEQPLSLPAQEQQYAAEPRSASVTPASARREQRRSQPAIVTPDSLVQIESPETAATDDADAPLIHDMQAYADRRGWSETHEEGASSPEEHDLTLTPDESLPEEDDQPPPPPQPRPRHHRQPGETPTRTPRHKQQPQQRLQQPQQRPQQQRQNARRQKQQKQQKQQRRVTQSKHSRQRRRPAARS